ncbi:Protein of unknown function [Cotesia congregata]|uniref:Uncharacterized protein n=1 Tax=Cotesia congregata TaxID=51543 RepID=A0A8J2HMU4_COTCN|nr:Protein of unknown function [Cotesia congregata]
MENRTAVSQLSPDKQTYTPALVFNPSTQEPESTSTSSQQHTPPHSIPRTLNTPAYQPPTRKRTRVFKTATQPKAQSVRSPSIKNFLQFDATKSKNQSPTSPPESSPPNNLPRSLQFTGDSSAYNRGTSTVMMPNPEELARDSEILKTLERWRKEDNQARETMKSELLREISEARIEHSNQLTSLREENAVLKNQINDLKARVTILETVNDGSAAAADDVSTQARTDNLVQLKNNLISASITAVDKYMRKNNIIVRGISVEADNAIAKLNDFIRANFKINNVVKDARLVNSKSPTIIATLSDASVKKTIMVKKKLLKPGVYIDHDLTYEEGAIAAKLRAEARKLRAEGKTVKIGHQRIYINGTGFRFDSSINSIVPCTSQSTSISTSPSAPAQSLAHQYSPQKQIDKYSSQALEEAITITFWNINVTRNLKDLNLMPFNALCLSETWLTSNCLVPPAPAPFNNWSNFISPALKENRFGRASGGLYTYVDDAHATYDAIILGGDFNARTGTFLSDEPSFFEGSVLKATRSPADTVSNHQGNILMDFMGSNDFILMNGRSPNDCPASVDALHGAFCSAITASASSSNMVIQRKVISASSSPTYSKQWFDDECKLKKRSVQRLLNFCKQNILNNALWSAYHYAKKDYRAMLSAKALQYQKNITNQFDSARSSSEFWKAVRAVRGRKALEFLRNLDLERYTHSSACHIILYRNPSDGLPSYLQFCSQRLIVPMIQLRLANFFTCNISVDKSVIKLQPKQTYCYCHNNEAETVKHFLLDCPFFYIPRLSHLQLAEELGPRMNLALILDDQSETNLKSLDHFLRELYLSAGDNI